MAAVVSTLRFKEPVDRALFVESERELADGMRAIDGFQGFHVVHTAETEVVLVILADTVEVLDQLATEVGSPWMLANVVPLLASPPDRHVGEVIASATARA